MFHCIDRYAMSVMAMLFLLLLLPVIRNSSFISSLIEL